MNAKRSRMDNILKVGTGMFAAIVSYLTPIKGLIVCAIIFVGIDFITGVWASKVRAKKRGESWGFESQRARKTVFKLALIMAGIILAWLVDSIILDYMNLNLAHLFTGFVCCVEFWSYLENAAEISDHPVFRWVKKFMKKKVDKILEE